MLTELFASMDPWDGQGRLDGSGGPGGPTGDTDEPDLSQSVLTAARKRRCPCCHGTGEHASGFECYRCDSSGDLDGDDPGEDSCDGGGMSATAAAEDGAVRQVPPEEYRKYQLHDYPTVKSLPGLVRHFKQNDGPYYAKIKADVQANGFTTPALVRFKDPRGNPLKKPVLWEGHHRAAVAHELGMHLPVADYDDTPAAEAAHRSNAEWFSKDPRAQHTATVHTAVTADDDDGNIHRGLTTVLPPDVHKFVHDPAQPVAARAHMLLAHVRKAKPEINAEEAHGTTGGLGNYWSPIKHKGAEYADQAGWSAYHGHEREHHCGNEYDGSGGCHTTNVVLHAGEPAEKHQWKENFRPGERYDRELSWRLPVRPGAPLHVKGISWREGNDHEPEDYSKSISERDKRGPYTEHDFPSPVHKQAGASGELPEGLTFRHITMNDGRLHHVVAEHPDAPSDKVWGDHHVGRISWGSQDPEVLNIKVSPEYHRRGVATELWNRAREIEPSLRHSDAQTDAGSNWAGTTSALESTAGWSDNEIPSGTRGRDHHGHEVEMTAQNGWAHLDGSYGEDGPTGLETVSDHPVTPYEHVHTWLPQGRYWGPNSKTLDQRLFDGEHLRPEISHDVMARVGSNLRQYKGWTTWTKVYFAGSQAAQWTDGKGEGNGDFDILIGIDWPLFRRDNPTVQGTDAVIAQQMTDDLWHHTNMDGYYFTINEDAS